MDNSLSKNSQSLSSQVRDMVLFERGNERIYLNPEEKIRGQIAALSDNVVFLTSPEKPGKYYSYDRKTTAKNSVFEKNHEFKVGDTVGIIDHPELGGMMSESIYDAFEKQATESKMTLSSYLTHFVESKIKEREEKQQESVVIHASSERSR